MNLNRPTLDLLVKLANTKGSLVQALVDNDLTCHADNSIIADGEVLIVRTFFPESYALIEDHYSFDRRTGAWTKLSSDKVLIRQLQKQVAALEKQLKPKEEKLDALREAAFFRRRTEYMANAHTINAQVQTDLNRQGN